MKIKFTTTFDAEIIKKLKKKAIDENVSVNVLIERWIKEHDKKGE